MKAHHVIKFYVFVWIFVLFFAFGSLIYTAWIQDGVVTIDFNSVGELPLEMALFIMAFAGFILYLPFGYYYIRGEKDEKKGDKCCSVV